MNTLLDLRLDHVIVKFKLRLKLELDMFTKLKKKNHKQVISQVKSILLK